MRMCTSVLGELAEAQLTLLGWLSPQTGGSGTHVLMNLEFSIALISGRSL